MGATFRRQSSLDSRGTSDTLSRSELSLMGKLFLRFRKKSKIKEAFLGGQPKFSINIIEINHSVFTLIPRQLSSEAAVSVQLLCFYVSTSSNSPSIDFLK